MHEIQESVTKLKGVTINKTNETEQIKSECINALKKHKKRNRTQFWFTLIYVCALLYYVVPILTMAQVHHIESTNE